MKDNKKTNVKKFVVLSIYFAIIFAIMIMLLFGRSSKSNRIGEFIYKASESALGSEVVDATSGQGNTETQTTTIEENVTKIGKVIVQYLDSEGNILKEADIIEGVVGKEYSTQRAEIEGYIAYGKDPMNKIGLFEETDITVTYKYISAIENVKIDNENNNVTVTVANGKQASEYKMRVVCQDLDGNMIDGLGIKVTDANEELLKQTKTINGKILVGSIVIKEEGEEIYKLEQVETPKGYNKILQDKYTITVNKSWNETEAKYEASFTYDENVNGISVVTTEDEILITINVEKILIYNLSMKKYISSIDETTVEGREPSIVSIDEDGVITYSTNEDEIHVKNGQNLVYNLRIYNEGNVTVNATEILENIPEGLIYVKDSDVNTTYNWRMYKDDGTGNLVETENEEEATVLKTNYLESQPIAGFENDETPSYKEVSVELKTTTQKAKVDRQLVNTASVKKLEKEIIEDNNQDTETVILDKVIENNLVLKKFTSRINNQITTAREPVVSVDEEDKITYEQPSEPLTVENGENLVFSLRVYNESEDPVQGAEVIDEIPEYLYFVEDSTINEEFGWETYKKDEEGNLVATDNAKEATVVKTSYLTTQTFSGFDKATSTVPDYKDLQLELVVTDEKIDEDVEVEKDGEVGEIEYETDVNDNKDSEKIVISKTKIYDINMKKFVSKIDETTVEDREPQVSVDEQGNVTYTKIGEIVKVSNGQKVEFTLREYNEGNMPLKGTEITDNIPEGLIFDKENETNKTYGWEMYTKDAEGNLVKTEDEKKATVVKTKKLETTDIKEVEGTVVSYADTKLVLKVTEEKIKEDTPIVNTAIAAKAPNEKTPEGEPDDNEGQEELIIEKTKVYDLGMKKFVSSIDGTKVEGREPVVSVDAEGKVTYTQNGEIVKVSNGQKVEFTLREYNEGNQLSKGTEVTDNIPEGLIFDKENETNKAYGWTMYTKDAEGNLVETEDETKATVVKTKYLETTDIKEIEGTKVNYADAKLILKVTEEKIEKDTPIVNTAKAEKLPNEKDPEEGPDNNEDEEELIIEKTKVYDLGMKKFVSSIDGTKVEGREPVVSVDAEGRVTYTQNGEIVRVSNGQKVEFTLRVYNEGNQLSKGTEVTDNIPEGLIFDKENETNKAYDWEMYTKDEEGYLVKTEDETKATVVKTKYLESTDIKEVEGTKVSYADVKLILKVTEERIKEDTEIVNKALIAKTPEDSNPDSNEGEEPLIIEQTKIYDLGMKKFVSKIDGTKVEGREPIVSVDAEGKVTYTKTGEIVRVSNGQKVEFTLREYNEGNQLSKGTEVTDNIPEGLIFDKENEINKAYGWTMYTKDAEGNLVETEDETKAIVVKTKYLESTDIKGIEGTKVNYADAKLVLKVTEEKIKADTPIINTAKAEKLPNEKDPEEGQPDNNEGEEELIIEKTKVYDLGMKKFVSSIDGTKVEGREPVVSVDAEGKVTYTKTGEVVKVSNGQEVEFTLREYNEGNEPSKGTEITDNIPEGLVFDKENETNKTYGWTMYTKDAEGNLVKTEDETKATVVKTKYLEATDIKEIEGTKVNYADAKLVLKVTEEKIEEDIPIVNTAKAEKLPNEKEPEEGQPDNNEGEEELIIEKTKVYDLGMKKFVSSIDGTKIEGREPVVSIDAEGKVTYTKTGEVVKVSNGQKVEFTLREYNEGNQLSKGTEITDNIPEGLLFDKENKTNKTYGWVMYRKDEKGNLIITEDETKATMVKTKYLETKDIKEIEGTKVSYADAKLVLKVTEEKIKEDTPIVNTAKAEKLPNEKDDDTENNEGQEELIIEKTKVYDLGMKKFVSKIDGTKVEGREPVVSVDTEGKVTYTQNGEIVKVSNGQKVEFTLREYNEGNQLSKGTEITDNIPEGLLFDKENETNKTYGWTMYTKDAEGNLVETEDETKATVVKTKYLETKDIKEIEGTKVNYADAKLVLKVTEEKIKADTPIINIAKAEKLPNEKDDDTENNEGQEELIIEKTKVYDLGMKKFVSSIDGTKVEGREPVVSVDGEGKVSYTKIGEIVKVSNGQEVEFTLREYNEGNEPSKGTEITDSIPVGLIFDKENATNKAYGWTMYTKDAEGNLVETKDETKATVVKTKYLETKDIKEIEGTKVNYADAKLVLKVTEETIEEDTRIVNIAKAEKTANEKDDDAKNNEGQEELIIEKTKEYNLVLKKFVSKLDNEEIKNRQPSINVDSEGNITYKQTEEIIQVANNQIVEFTLRLYNEGKIAGKGTEIIDNIPAGLIFDKENETNKTYGWVMYKEDEKGNLIETKDEKEATAVKTNYLLEKEIDKYNEELKSPSYEDVKVAFKVTEDEINEDRIITNSAKIIGTDSNQEDNESEEKLKVKYFDLDLTKYITKVVIEDDENTYEHNLGIENKGKLFKAELEAKKLETTKIYITYSLKVENIGEIPGYAKELIDYIPDGLELIEDEKWSAKDGVATSTSMANEIINPGESKTIDINFVWDVSDKRVGNKENEAKISVYYNEYDAEDVTNGNSDKENMLISIRTGKVKTYFAGVMIVLVITLIGTIILQKNNNK